MEKHIILFKEEIDSLESGKEICIFEDDEKDIKIFIQKEMTEEEILKGNILDRYNNEEYWNRNIL